MYTHTDKTSEHKSRSAANSSSEQQANHKSTYQFVNNEPGVIVQKEQEQSGTTYPGVQQVKSYQEMTDNSRQIKQLRAYQLMADKYTSQKAQQIEHPVKTHQGKFDLVHKKENSNDHTLTSQLIIEPHQKQHIVQQKKDQPGDVSQERVSQQNAGVNSGAGIVQRRVIMVEPKPDWIMLRNAQILSEKGGGAIQHLFDRPSLAGVDQDEILYLVGHGSADEFGNDVDWSPGQMADFLASLKLPLTHRYILLSGVCNSAAGDGSFAEILKTTLTDTYKYENSVVIGAVGLAIAGFGDGWQDTVVRPESEDAEIALENIIKKEKGVSEGIAAAEAIIAKNEIPDIAARAAVISKLVGPFYVRLAEEHAKRKAAGKPLTFDKNDPEARVGFYS